MIQVNTRCGSTKFLTWSMNDSIGLTVMFWTSFSSCEYSCLVHPVQFLPRECAQMQRFGHAAESVNTDSLHHNNGMTRCCPCVCVVWLLSTAIYILPLEVTCLFVVRVLRIVFLRVCAVLEVCCVEPSFEARGSTFVPCLTIITPSVSS